MTTPEGFVSGWLPARHEDIDGETMKQVTAMIDLFPELPIHVRELISIVSDYESNSKDVAKLASSDPVLAAKILNAVNSAYYALSRKIDNLRLAIVLLGYGEVRNIALRCGISEVLGGGGVYKGYSTGALWKHSYLVSVCAESFESNPDSTRAGVLLTLGLLHDIGKFALVNAAKIMRDKKIKIAGVKTAGDVPYVLAKEQELFGIHHSIIGALITREWGLPKHISDIIEYHHYPSFFPIDDVPGGLVKEVAVISVSDYLVNLYTGQKNMLPEPGEAFLDVLMIDSPLNEMLTPELTDKLDKAKQFLAYIS